MDKPLITDPYEAMLSLRTLTTQLGWYVLEAFLLDNAKAISEALLDPSSTMTEDERKVLTLKRYYQLQILKLPEIISDKFQQELGTDVSWPVNVDPYSQSKDTFNLI